MPRLTLHALLALCVVTAGCTFMGPDYPRSERAVEALADAKNTTGTVESYRFTSEMRITATSDGRTEQIDIAVTGVVATDTRRIRSNTSFDDESRQTYVLNRTVYRECASPWDGWASEELDEDTKWQSQTPAVRQLSLLESGALYWNGTETMNGESMMVMTGKPTSEALTSYRDDREQPLVGGPSIDDAELRAWLDADTDRLRKTELRFTIADGGSSARTTMTTTFSGYDKSTDIELPEEAHPPDYELGCPGD